ncbi:hypothetical protein MM236_08300 [Belliella sp. DSM 107340]|uniref:Lipoprotein n=1 Tax=Belliella calami TaxID=2923436 RepID=A0ABS9UMZ7_9BACT|nr:hypothetical protein [Belliella calami]MCH7397987.1 hypothetical protein [Belliella calami]
MKNFALGVFLLIAVFSIVACDGEDKKHQISHYFDKSEQDTLLTNIVTYIYKVPRGVDPKKKFDLEYRKLYVGQIQNFEFLNYFIDQDSTHYFQLIRPARNEKGYRRGVLGKFKLGNDFELIDFEEIANTPMLPVDEIKEKGTYLWKDLMYFKNLDRYFLNKEYVEFPDDRARYDKVKNEWTYEKL